jgi:hypothetical protein
MENSQKYSHIRGWNIDSDPRNEPTYPMKNYTGDDHKRLNYERPPQQEPTVEVLHSNERPSLSAVFGTTVPPHGISGAIRRFAFRYSEGSFGHWFPLILADKINVLEGYFDDFGKGKVPNVFAEHGIKSEWKHNRKELVTNVITGVVVSAVVCYFLFGKTKKAKS